MRGRYDGRWWGLRCFTTQEQRIRIAGEQRVYPEVNRTSQVAVTD